MKRAGRPDVTVGADCEDIERWRRMLPDLRNRTAKKLFTDQEHRYCRQFHDPAPHYAARWCAKEAVLKALAPHISVDLRWVEVLRDVSGRPAVGWRGPDRAALRKFKVDLSLAHSRKAAMAVAIAWRPKTDGKESKR